MHYSFIKSCLLAIAATSSVVLAQTTGFNVMSQPTYNAVIPAGSVYDIVWTPTATYPGNISIVFYGGPSAAGLAVISTLVSGISPTVGKYSWSVPADAGSLAAYGIRINLDSDASIYQWSNPFTISSSSASVTGGSTSAGGVTTTIKISQISTIASTTTTTSPSTSASSTSSSASVSSTATVSTTVSSSTTTLATVTTAPTGASNATTTTATTSSTTSKSTNGANAAAATGTGLLGALMLSLAMII